MLEAGHLIQARFVSAFATIQQFFQKIAERPCFKSLQLPPLLAKRVVERSGTEVAQQGFSRGIDKQVVPIKVAMKNAAPMQVRDGIGHPDSDAHSLIDGKAL